MSQNNAVSAIEVRRAESKRFVRSRDDEVRPESLAPASATAPVGSQADPSVDLMGRLAPALESIDIQASEPAQIGKALALLIEQGLDRLPRPAHGNTLERWQALSRVAERDLALVKLYEGHTDALAILAELGAQTPAMTRWGVFAAEPPDFRATIRYLDERHRMPGAPVELNGAKAWCSGAQSLTHALLTCCDAEGVHRLVAIELDQPGVSLSNSNWHAVGMAATASVDLILNQAKGSLVGEANAYLSRPGFWHGGAGIAACWYGGALPLAKAVARATRRMPEPHRAAHLGAIDVALRAAASALREAAQWIDAHPTDDAMSMALRVRLLAEASVTEVINHAGRSLGAGPLCRDPAIARCMADLPVFLRQSHAERDLAVLGEWHARESDDDTQWCL